MKLVEPNIAHQKKIVEMLDEFTLNGEEKAYGGSKASKYRNDYSEWLSYLKSIKSPTDEMLSKGYTPTIQYVLYDEDEPVGFFCARLELTEVLMHAGGHIGYSIRPSKRGQNYATNGLKLLVEEYRKLGVDAVMLCCYEENVGSATVIEKCGGVFDSIVVYDNRNIKKFWININ